MPNIVKNIAFLIAIVAVCLFGLWYVTRAPIIPADTNHIGVTTGTASSSNPADVFAALLDQLSGVDFQRGTTIFANPVFRTGLMSFRRELPSIDRARANPFAPLEGAPGSYIHYVSPLPASLTPTATTSSAFPTATTSSVKATTSKR